MLSHRWTDEEATFLDICSGALEGKPGFDKIRGMILQAQRKKIQHIWIDTYCIDKRNSAELSEAINSMYTWYKAAAYCFFYLHNVDHRQGMVSFKASSWFTRGWTLQKMLAPSIVESSQHY
jgi:hypothetical protein